RGFLPARPVWLVHLTIAIIVQAVRCPDMVSKAGHQARCAVGDVPILIAMLNFLDESEPAELLLVRIIIRIAIAESNDLPVRSGNTIEILSDRDLVSRHDL